MDIQKAAIGATLPEQAPISELVPTDVEKSWQPVSTTIEEELNTAGDEAMNQLREQQREMIDSLDLSK